MNLDRLLARRPEGVFVNPIQRGFPVRSADVRFRGNSGHTVRLAACLQMTLSRL
jgi:hypothetical protein